MKKRVRFIVNPFSGTSQKGGFPNLVDTRLDKSLFSYEISYTEYAGHATVLAEEAVSNGVDIVVAVGGDGSVNEVAQALCFSDTVLGILPGGSGNGFAMHLGLGRNVGKAINVLNHGKIKTIDTCTINERFFINVAGIGFDARIAHLTKKDSKRGFLNYFKTSLREVKNFKMVSLDVQIDNEHLSGDYALASIANATMFGYYFTIAPPAKLDDGMLDIILVKKASLFKYALSSFRLLNKTLDKSRSVIHKQGKNIKISLKDTDYYHVDGEG